MDGSAQKWFKGSVTLADKQVLTGDISVDTQYDLVLYKNGNLVDVYPAHRVYATRIYDSTKHINRRYVSIKDQINPRHVELFEIVTSGEISVLRREVTRYSTTTEHEALGFEYFVLFEDELIGLKEFNPKVYSKLKGNDVTQSFVRRNKLNPNIDANAVRIIQYHNKMVASAEVVKR